MAATFPAGQPISVKLVEAGIDRGPDSVTTNMVLEYEFASSWLVAHVAVRTKDGRKSISGLHVTPLAEPLEVTNEFTLAGKGPSQYIGLCLAVLLSAFTLYAFVQCIGTRMGKKKFIWLVLIVVGVCRLNLNWTTGQWFFWLLNIQAPPVRMRAAPYGPWLIDVSLPVGAIAFFILREKLRADNVPADVWSHSLSNE